MKNIYQEITDQIVQALEQGVRPWHQPWNAAHMEGNRHEPPTWASRD